MDKETRRIIKTVKQVTENLEQAELDRIYPFFRGTNLLLYGVTILLIMAFAVGYFIFLGFTDLLVKEERNGLIHYFILVMLWTGYVYCVSRTVKKMQPKWRFINL